MKGMLRKIFGEHIDQYSASGRSEEMRRRPHLYGMIKKMLLCGGLGLGVYTYRCRCGKHAFVVAIPCKTRICLRCGWSNSLKQRERALHKVLDTNHFFTTFTIPHNLQTIFVCNRKVFLTAMFQAITATVKSYTKVRGYTIEPGIVGIPHTFGSLMQRHVHFHVLITMGGLCKNTGKWVNVKHYPVAYLKKHFRAKFLNKLRSLHRQGKLKFEDPNYGEYRVFNRLLDAAYSHTASWHTQISLKVKKKHIYAKDGDVVNALFYAFRYLCRLPISEKNIVSYDGRTVVWYRKKKEAEYHESEKNSQRRRRQTETVEAFIEKLLIHIPDKGEKQVYYALLYGPYQKKRAYKCALDHHERIRPNALKKSEKPEVMSWAEMRKWHSKEGSKDPTLCGHCHSQVTRVGMIRANEFGTLFCRTHTVKNNEIVLILDSS